jgi:hypothetical protein
MRGIITITAILIAASSLAIAQGSKSPYAGQEEREIKSLSMETIQGYLAGEGMGLAKAAELNHYPGPKHVLGLSGELDLSKEQLSKTEEIFNKMHEEAARLGKLMVEKEKTLDNLFAEEKIDKTRLRSFYCLR